VAFINHMTNARGTQKYQKQKYNKQLMDQTFRIHNHFRIKKLEQAELEPSS